MTRGWKGNALGLQKWEVLCAHQTRLDATEAIAARMMRGETFDQAKAAVVKQVDRIHKFSRPELYEGHRRVARSVEFGDLPRPVLRKISDDFLAGVERARGKKAGRIERWFYNLTGLTF